jgi:hypothetical protein
VTLRASASRTSFVYTGDQRMDDIQSAKNELARKVGANPLANAASLTGLLQTDGSTSDGIAFTVGNSVELAHGLGRRASGFVVTDSQLGPAMLYRVTSTSGLEDTHIKLTLDASAPRDIRVKLAVY